MNLELDDNVGLHRQSTYALKIDTEFDAINAGRCVLPETGDRISRHRCIDDLIRQIPAPQPDGEGLVLRVDVHAGIDGIISGLSELIVRLTKPTAVVQEVGIKGPIPD